MYTQHSNSLQHIFLLLFWFAFPPHLICFFPVISFVELQLLSMFDLDPDSADAECLVLLIEKVTCYVASLGYEEVERLLAEYASAPLPAWDTIAGIRRWLVEQLGQSPCINGAHGESPSPGAQQESGRQLDTEAVWARNWSFLNWETCAQGYACSENQPRRANPLLQKWDCAAKLRAELILQHHFAAVLPDDQGTAPNFSQVFDT